MRGLVVEADSGEPISGALVIVLGADSSEVGAAMSSATGAYFIRAPAPGSYRLRADRIGYGSTLTESFDLTAGESASRRIEASARPVELATLMVEGERDGECRLTRDAGIATYSAWEEARKALQNAAWTDRARRYRLIGERYTMYLDREGRPLHLRSEAHRGRGDASTEDSIVSYAGYTRFESLPAHQLAEIGYVVVLTDELNDEYAIFPGRPDVDGAIAYFGPDAEVLLSETFHADHCFLLERGSGANAGRVGLAFRPIRRPTRADIEGTLWLDPETAELHSLDFRYVGKLPPRKDGLRASGHVEFDRLGGGEMIVRSWWIQMPGLNTGVPHLDELSGWTRQGGRVTEVVSTSQ